MREQVFDGFGDPYADNIDQPIGKEERVEDRHMTAWRVPKGEPRLRARRRARDNEKAQKAATVAAYPCGDSGIGDSGPSDGRNAEACELLKALLMERGLSKEEADEAVKDPSVES